MSHFNHAANNWDSEGKIKLMAKLSEGTLKKLNLDLNKAEKKLDILDFGCGTGLFGLEFIDYAKSILGVDTSEGMLEVFEKKVEGLENIKTKLMNLEREDLDQSFDLIVSSMVFHHLDSPKKTLIKLAKILNPGGNIAIVDLEKEDGSFHPDPAAMGVKHFGFSPEEIEGWAKEADLNVSLSTINSVEKNDKTYPQFLAVFNRR